MAVPTSPTQFNWARWPHVLRPAADHAALGDELPRLGRAPALLRWAGRAVNRVVYGLSRALTRRQKAYNLSMLGAVSELGEQVREIDAMVNPESMRQAMLALLGSEEYRRTFHWALGLTLRQPDILNYDPLGTGARVDKGTQILLAERYKELVRTGQPLPSLREVGFRSFSQFDEDGILHFIFSVIGTTNRKAIEACAGCGYESCSANLIVHHGWDALLLDGDEQNCKLSWNFFTQRTDTQITAPKIAAAWIEPDTINDLIRSNGFTGDIDLLTIDMDGIDYWVWKAIDCVNPRVVVVEYQPWWGPDEPYTIKNIKGYRYPDYHEKMEAYVGCSLGAYVNLARERGYRLVGCNRNELNAFFVRDDLARDLLPEVSIASCLTCRRVMEVRQHVRRHVEAQLARGEWVRG